MFNVKKNGVEYEADVLTNFELYGDHYCVYTIPNSDYYDVYCAKIVDGKLIDIKSEKEKEMTNIVVSRLIDSVK